MTEYEIYDNNEDNDNEQKEIILNTNKKNKNFRFKDLFNLNFISITLAIISIFCSMLVGFIPLVKISNSSLLACASFFFIGFALAFAGLIIETIKMVKFKEIKFNVQLLIVIIALIISCLLLPMSSQLFMF